MKRIRRAALPKAGRLLGGLGILVALVFLAGALARSRTESILQRLLDDFASTTVREQSGGAYQLSVAKVKLNWVLRQASLDSAVLTTDSLTNAGRDTPLPTLRVGLYGCTIGGVSLHRIILSKGLLARRFGCGVVTIAVSVPRRPDTAAVAPEDSDTAAAASFLVMQRGLKLPGFAPRLRVRHIAFPHTSFVLELPRRQGPPSRIALEHLEWSIRDLIIDPDDPLAASRPLFSRAIDIGGENFAFQSDSVMRLGAGRMHVSLTDSTATLADIAYGPTMGDAAFARLQPWRRSRVQMSVKRLRASGIDFGMLLRRGGVYARRLDADSLTVDIWGDKRLPGNPNPRVRLTPQAWLAAGPFAYHVDTLEAQGRVIYRELREGHDRNGVLTFNRINAVASNIHHIPGRSTTDDPMTLSATAYLMGVGRLSTTFVVPLDAPRFTMTYRGTLGPMPAEAFNRFVEHAFPARITGGRVQEIRFRATVRNGVARGELTPVYEDFGISITGRGASGLLGGRGELSKIARGVASWFANETKIRSRNPDRPDRAPRVAPITHAFESYETLPQFLWLSVRDPLLSVIRK